MKSIIYHPTIQQFIKNIRRTDLKLIIPCPYPEELFIALKEMTKLNFFKQIILIGKKSKIFSQVNNFEISEEKITVFDVNSDQEASRKAAVLSAHSSGHILMKGQLSTRIFLQGVLGYKSELTQPNTPLTQVGIFLPPTYPKLLISSDAGILISPDLSEKKKIIINAIQVAHRLNIAHPKVALIAAVEKVNSKIPATVDADALVKELRHEKALGAVVEGPYDIFIATNQAKAAQKGISGKVVGDADILIFPDLNSANIFYKTLMNFVPGAIAASVVGGSCNPIVLPSRSDSAENRYFSVIVAAYLSSAASQPF